MSRSLRIALSITDYLFLAYWTLAGLSAVGAIHIPPDWLYANADQPQTVAWNWSFFPLDIAFAMAGLAALRAARLGRASWAVYALISLVLTMTAGGMAVSYWALLGEFDPAWFLPNLALVIWPMFFLPGLIGQLKAPPGPEYGRV